MLREIALQLLPRELVDRPKMGFAVPVAGWFRGELGDRFRELVLTPDVRFRDHLNVAEAERLLSEHQSGSVDNSARLWGLLMFEQWARRWLAVEAVVVA